MALAERVNLGGYGAIKFATNDLEASNNSFDFRRLVLRLDASPTKRLHVNFELEFERFTALELPRTVEATDGSLRVEQAVEDSNKSELKIEQAWIQFDLVLWMNLRAGALLMPLGRFNLSHDDNRWHLPQRPLADRGALLLPVKSAWTELGIGVAGDVPVGMQGWVPYEMSRVCWPGVWHYRPVETVRIGVTLQQTATDYRGGDLGHEMTFPKTFAQLLKLTPFHTCIMEILLRPPPDGVQVTPGSQGMTNTSTIFHRIERCHDGCDGYEYTRERTPRPWQSFAQSAPRETVASG